MLKKKLGRFRSMDSDHQSMSVTVIKTRIVFLFSMHAQTINPVPWHFQIYIHTRKIQVVHMKKYINHPNNHSFSDKIQQQQNPVHAHPLSSLTNREGGKGM